MKGLTVALLLCTLLVPCPVEAEEAKKPRVGLLQAGAPLPGWTNPPLPPFMQQLRDLGWVKGENFEVVARSASGRLDRLPALARELVEMNVDVIVTFGATIRPAAAATRTIPIVMIAGSADPVADGLVKSLAHPGTNVTGVAWSAGAQLIGKNLQLLKEILPRLSRVALLYDGVTGPAFVAALALAHRLPTFSLFRELPEAGGLLSYGPSLAQLHRRGAEYVDKILRGAKPGDLPIEQPSQFEMVINLKAAKALGLTIPRTLLLQADHVLE